MDLTTITDDIWFNCIVKPVTRAGMSESWTYTSTRHYAADDPAQDLEEQGDPWRISDGATSTGAGSVCVRACATHAVALVPIWSIQLALARWGEARGSAVGLGRGYH